MFLLSFLLCDFTAARTQAHRKFPISILSSKARKSTGYDRDNYSRNELFLMKLQYA